MVIAYPTEGVWGLGCDPFNEQALLEILRLKQRPYEKGVILVAASIDQVEPFLAGITPQQRQRLETTWPGANTWIVPHNGHCPPWIRGEHQSLALRVSAHPVVQALCTHFGGPIVSTSANPASLPAADSAAATRAYFPNEEIIYAPGEVGSNGKPTQIRDLITGQTLRAG
jgi:L-threonylcarbamoyladenylate synthase